ncbi:MAG TPA: SDR family NAD(P)-dependent oxidoreductase [Ktedonobacterales bacterium]|nr:SDR family NAD(P)-dependent oxidoreductase [Ktedonobacterales bacterium]
MAGKLQGEVALVTGASSGIGAATALELARQGARLALAARRADELAATAEAITRGGGEARVFLVDMADPRQVEHLASAVVEAFGRVDLLVNNAGIGARPLIESSFDDISRVVGVNLLGPMLLTRALLPGMRERRHGAIISVASVSAHVATDPLYSGTKFGLRGFSLSLNRKLRGSGVSASLISPGFIRTPLTARRRGPMPGPEVVARAIAGLARHPKREVIVPRVYRGAVWAERLAPWLVDRATGTRVP